MALACNFRSRLEDQVKDKYCLIDARLVLNRSEENSLIATCTAGEAALPSLSNLNQLQWGIFCNHQNFVDMHFF